MVCGWLSSDIAKYYINTIKRIKRLMQRLWAYLIKKFRNFFNKIVMQAKKVYMEQYFIFFFYSKNIYMLC